MGIFNLWTKPKTYRPHILLQQLEERIVLDAAVTPAMQENPVTDTGTLKDTPANAAASTDYAPVTAAGVEPPTLPTKFDHLFSQDLNVVLVSNAVGDVQGITDAVKENAHVIVFDSAQDGLVSVKARLDSLVNETGQKIDVLAVITHGSDGNIDIGQDHVTRANFWAYQVFFQALATDLTVDAQLQFYSCDTAESGVGQALVSNIALATGADVFASSDTTGGVGRNWVLEYSSDSTVRMTGILDPQTLGGLNLELGGQPGEPRDAWFHGTGLFQGWDIYNYSQGVYYTKDYKVAWDHRDSGAWRYYNTAAWVTTDDLGSAPYGDGNHYADVNAWFTIPSGVGSYSGHQAYIGAGVEYYQDDTGSSPVHQWAHYDSTGSWSHWDGSVWRPVTGFEAYPQNTWFHLGQGGYDGYDYAGGLYYTKDYKVAWDHRDSGAWRYYNTAAWVTTNDLGNAPYGDGNHYAAVETWFTVPSGVGSYSGHQAYIGSGIVYYQDNTGAVPPHYWAYYYSTSSWEYYDGTSWNSVSGFGETYTYNVNDRIEYWVMYYMNQYRSNPVSGPWGVPAAQPALIFNSAVDYMAEQHLLDILNSHVWAHNSTAFPSGWQTLEQRGTQIGWQGWSTGQVGEDLFIQFYDLNGNYQLDQGTNEIGSYDWSGWTDTQAQQFAQSVVYAFVVDDASSNWGHRTPITNEQGWQLYYAGVAADRGVVAVNFSTFAY
ncbi:MAG: DUF4347 domain-containing protein [Desulfomonile tiedjei]|nr:DUF4347 domain-containing protein [Desulfomonile tiedjei]